MNEIPCKTCLKLPVCKPIVEITCTDLYNFCNNDNGYCTDDILTEEVIEGNQIWWKIHIESIFPNISNISEGDR